MSAPSETAVFGPARALTHREHGWLIAQLAVVLAPLLRALPLVTCAVFGVLLLWRTLLWVRRAPLPGKWVLGLTGVATLLVTLALAMRTGGNIGRDLSVALLGAFLVLKLMESHTVRNGVLVTQLCCFLLLSQVLFDQPPWLAASMLATVALLLRNWLVLLHPQARTRVSPARVLTRLVLMGLPCAAVLFFLFPRLDHPLWRLPQAADTATSGLSDRMAPGSVGQLILSDDLAFRADFAGAPPPLDTLYWRGLVLWRFDGQAWTAASMRQRPAAEGVPDSADAAGSAADMVDYNITLEPTRQRWLFALDRGVSIDARDGIRRSIDGEFVSTQVLDQRMRYHARSRLPGRRGADDAGPLDPLTWQLALALPPGNPQARSLAAQWADLPPAERISAALKLFGRAPFAYTLEPEPLQDQQIDDFLFRTHRGFCEHYAGSFVFLMRAAGVPARVVVGYLGGEVNAVSGDIIVRQSDAHAWAEVWLDGRGWVRVDPTAAVAPQRVERGLAAAVPASEFRSRRAEEPAWLRNVRWGLDGLISGWNRWVLGYDRSRQARLFAWLGLDAADPRAVLWGVSGLVLLAALPLLWQPRKPKPDPVQAQWQRLCDRLARHGCPRAPAEGPMAYAERAAAHFPHAAQAIREAAAGYVALRYGRDAGDAQARARQFAQWRQLLAQLHLRG
jgi:transglutaminase-like putative cysteine protease